MAGRLQHLRYRVGFRGLGLLTFASTAFAYGTGIEMGYRPTFSEALGLPITAFGWLFIAVGVFALTGVMAVSDRWHYCVCAMGVTAWVFTLATHWTAPYGWTAAVSWASVAAACLIASAWPEPPHTPSEPGGESRHDG